MISAIVLAAGMSTRLGRPKQLLSLGEETIIERVVDNLIMANVDEIVVVLGHYDDEIRPLLTSLNIKIVYNPYYKAGQSTSLVRGLNSIEEDCTGILCMLGDQPLVEVNTLNQLITEFKYGKELIVWPEYKGQRGNPVIFDSKLKIDMLEMDGDQGARPLLHKYRTQSRGIEVKDQGVVFDIDTEEDYEKLLNTMNS
ncbi:molybdenum cofactor cytidylyltransferase [Selenihalanaerobacter shriftii]|uniref:Molybdenum cofactor cytidylyltransferase n=1 Tax=Selenihalanaerobacter shriftii TaxID=142842 RepID=A0A1T4JTJ9_9FIRM|nr:molybdenum cofactor cytidylyltransferase [Selenihalanaerobacter shriftii]SJZ33434.1 molybdenum cofactor cytidylyltransferase [Selenihalanaerobacter shriftii]